MRFSHLYDHVLSELELGRTEMAVHLLVGILDTAAMQGNAAQQARNELLEHPLLEMLQEYPLSNLTSENVAAVTGNSISSTGRRLFAATRETALARALRDRTHHAEDKLHRAWRAGKRILLIADRHSGLMQSMAGFDASNITIRSADEIGAGQNKYHMILAQELPDNVSPSNLAIFTGNAAAQLTEDGEIVLSALLPGHPGSGWRSICMGWEPHCHDDRALLSAVPPGLIARSYHDENECVVWVEMRPEHNKPCSQNQDQKWGRK